MDMGIKQTRKITVIGLAGGDIVVSDETQIKAETTIEVTCDNPKCVGKFPGKDSGPTVVKWVVERAQENADEIPDEAWRLITRYGFNEEPKTYCCRQCEREATKNYVAPISPREQTRMDAACAAVTAKTEEPK
jgi:hypothetical protein